MFTVWKQRFLIDPLLRMSNLPELVQEKLQETMGKRHQDDG